MNRKLVVSFVAMAVVTGAMAQSATNARLSSVPPTAEAKTNAVLGVETFMRGVSHYQGRVQVEGVVRTVSAKTHTLALIDVAEFEKCGLADCAELVLPVRWAGTMPSVGQNVRVSGEVQKQKTKLVFVASEVEKVQPPEKKKK